jgi:nucleotide-binding universal stress UspA family protein
MKTILVPIDMSNPDPDGSALALARGMAAAEGGKIVLLSVIEQVPGFVAAQIPPDFHEKVQAETGAELRKLAGQRGLADDTEVVVRDGHPSTEILEYAEAIGADMIVIASHDPGPVDYLLGSVAARVARHAHCSVLIVRKRKG